MFTISILRQTSAVSTTDVHKTLSRKTETRPRRFKKRLETVLRQSRDRDVQDRDYISGIEYPTFFQNLVNFGSQTAITDCMRGRWHTWRPSNCNCPALLLSALVKTSLNTILLVLAVESLVPKRRLRSYTPTRLPVITFARNSAAIIEVRQIRQQFRRLLIKSSNDREQVRIVYTYLTPPYRTDALQWPWRRRTIRF